MSDELQDASKAGQPDVPVLSIEEIKQLRELVFNLVQEVQSWSWSSLTPDRVNALAVALIKEGLLRSLFADRRALERERTITEVLRDDVRNLTALPVPATTPTVKQATIKERIAYEISRANCCGYTPDMTEIYREIEELERDKVMFDWLLNHIRQHGVNGLYNFKWSNPAENDPLEEDDVILDRTAISAAMEKGGLHE